jgi:predicted MFS family arabinose efflux permease
MSGAAGKPAAPASQPVIFTGYQKFAIGVLAFMQFAVILDFMLMSPLGATIMPSLAIGPQEFGLVVSAYAFSAGLSGLLAAGFADRYDRKRILLFFYTGFIVGTAWCGLADSFASLLAARIVTGLFGGVIGSTVLAIATDLFPPQARGRVMGVIQTAFAASQVLGIPVSLFLSNRWNWHVPFLALVLMGAVGWLIVALRMRPVAEHLKLAQEHSAFRHMLNTVTEPRYLAGFATTALVTTGGFMLMPFSSAFVVNNLGISLHSLPTVYLVTGCCTIFVGPLVGKAADAFGKSRVFLFGTIVSMLMVVIYTHLGPVSLPTVVIVNALMFVGIFSRMIPFQALMASVPAPQQRGAFNAINASIQQMAGGLASVVAGHIVTLGAGGRIEHFETIGYIVVATALVALALVWAMQRSLAARAAPAS